MDQVNALMIENSIVVPRGASSRLKMIAHRFICIRARLIQFEIPFIYCKTGGSPCKFYGGDGISSMFLRKMDFSIENIPLDVRSEFLKKKKKNSPKPFIYPLVTIYIRGS